jgi:uncharacterized coiled-coil protein SlyX
MKPNTDVLQERIKSLREALDRADALASVQERTITVLESSLAMQSKRIAELEGTIAIYKEAT